MSINNPKSDSAEYKSSRVSEIICLLIKKGDYFKIDDIADEMYVSRSTVDRLIPEVREKLSYYNLKLLTKPKYGICVDGLERDKRLCYSNHFDISNSISDETQFGYISEILSEAVEKYDLQMNDINFYNLVNHCSIAIERIRKGNFVSNEDIDITVENENLLNCAREICEQFERRFNISIPENESQYILMHLLGKGEVLDSNVIKEEVWDIVRNIFDEIKEKYDLDLRSDTEVVTALAMHIQPLLYRSKYRIEQDNPLLKKIKSDMNEGYDLAVLAKDVISRKTGILIGEDEIGYIALHLSLALRRIDRTEKNKKIIVVCTTGQGTARMIKYKLMNQFGFGENDLTLIPLYRLDRTDLSDYNCILSTIPLEQKYSIPAFLVSFENDISFSQSFASYISRGKTGTDLDRNLLFSHQKFETADDILRFMGGKIEEYYGFGSDFTESILKRERLASTEVGNLLAVPHAFEYAYQHSILSVLVLDKKIRWKNQQVQVVVLCIYPLNVDNSIINDRIAELASDPDKIESIINDQSYYNINRCLLGDGK